MGTLLAATGFGLTLTVDWPRLDLSTRPAIAEEFQPDAQDDSEGNEADQQWPRRAGEIKVPEAYHILKTYRVSRRHRNLRRAAKYAASAVRYAEEADRRALEVKAELEAHFHKLQSGGSPRTSRITSRAKSAQRKARSARDKALRAQKELLKAVRAERAKPATAEQKLLLRDMERLQQALTVVERHMREAMMAREERAGGVILEY